MLIIIIIIIIIYHIFLKNPLNLDKEFLFCCH
jgi:hypothetical protein